MKLKLFVCGFMVIISSVLFAKGSMLTDQCGFESIPQVFVEGHEWVDFPTYNDRGYWNAISPEIKAVVIKRGEAAIKQEPIAISGYDYMRFKQGICADVVTLKLETKINRLEDIMLAEILEGKGRFINEISSLVWDFCSLNNWTAPESQYLQTGRLSLPSLDKAIVDEMTGEIASALSWAYFFFDKEFTKVDPNISKWIVSTVRSKFLVPSLEKYDFFWMCYQSKQASYQTPWISYNWLLSDLLIEKENANRQKSIFKSLQCLDHFYKSNSEDGGCMGGPEIWQYTTGKYFEALEVLELVSVGEIDTYNDEKLRAMAEYICQSYIGNQYVFNYSETSPKLKLPAGLIYRMGEKVGSDMMMGFGSFLANEMKKKGEIPSSCDMMEKIRYVINYDKIISHTPAEPLMSDAYLPNSQMVIARSSEGSTSGFFFGVKGGNNGEFANQNDVGSFILYVDGLPFVVDPGKISKTAKIVGDERYDVWVNQSSWHSLPTVNGYMQEVGAHHSAVDLKYAATPASVNVSMDLVHTYTPHAGIQKWVRNYDFDRKSGLEVTDNYALANTNGESSVSFIFYSKPISQKPGSVVFKINGKSYEFSYKSAMFKMNIDEIKTTDDQTLKVWGNNLYRVVLTPTAQSKSGAWSYSFRQI